MATVRKNQAALTRDEWSAFVDALEAVNGFGSADPAYPRFVRVHVNAMSPVGMSWAVHTMNHMGHTMVGRNFLPWHRQFLLAFERRLQRADPSVSIPYWNTLTQPRVPARLGGRAFLSRWALSREWRASRLPTTGLLNAALAQTTFESFQLGLEDFHNYAHRAVGGTMATANSPADPLFWLHHANLDRIWAEWQREHPGARPANGRELLQPAPMFGRAVSGVVSVSRLGYGYA